MESSPLTLTTRLRLGAAIVLLLLAANALLAFGMTEGKARTLVGVLGAASILALGAAAWWLISNVARPLSNAVRTAKGVTSGDLTVSIDSRGAAEIGELMQSLAALRELMFGVVSQVRIGTTTVAGTASQLQRDNTSLADRTRDQTEALQATAESMRKITAAVKENADHASRASALVLSASENASDGGRVVAEVVETMAAIRQSSRKIVDIVSVIDGIAFQTNILALNAAVESARAGEHGTGFAIVAAEVRTLAKRSASAAKEIKALIAESVGKIESGGKLVDGAGNAMSEIVKSVQVVADLIQRISAESTIQSTNIDSINTEIDRLEKMVHRNALVVKETTGTGTILNEYAVSLLSTVAPFNLGLREHGNAEEAIALVKSAIEFYNEHGAEELIAEINRLGKGRFIDRDLYLMAIGIDDFKFKAHGNNPRTLGLGPQSKDADGKRFVVEMIDIAKTGRGNWLEYKWNHPVTNQILTKATYVEAAGNLAIACGVYKR